MHIYLGIYFIVGRILSNYELFHGLEKDFKMNVFGIFILGLMNVPSQSIY